MILLKGAIIVPTLETKRLQLVPEYRKQGYATEMARSLVAWAFQETGIKVVTASCLEDNIASIKVLENVGMQRLEPDGNLLKWEIRKHN